MSPQVDFIFDFGSPNAYFVHKVIPGIEWRTETEFTYVPCLLGGIFKETGNRSPFLAFAEVKGKLAYDRLEIQRFIQKHKLVDFKLNSSFPVNTLLLMRGAAAAELDGILPQYVNVGMAAMWEQDLKMDDPDVFVSAFEAAGMDGARLLARAQEDDAKQRLKDNTSAAVNRGVFGSPTFFVGDEMFFGKERLGQVEDEIKAQLKKS